MHSFYTRYGKRTLDVFLSLVIVMLLSWLIILIILVYTVSGQFPILYRQQRMGKERATFTFLKLRTLTTDESLPLQQRRFAFGNLLRRTNLDELPQLWNVLKGEMSLVGPRPLPVEYDKLFSAAQHIRHTVRPGITGLAQVSGKNSISWPEKFRHDIHYVNHISVRLDCLILFKTLTLALSLKRDVSLEEDKFTG